MKKFNITLLMIVIMILTVFLAGCNGKAESTPKPSSAPEATTAPRGNIVRSGRLEAFCPDGWNVKKIKDTYSESGENTDSIMLVKDDYYEGYSTDSGYVRIDCADEAFPDIREYYGNTLYIALIVDGRKWEGFSGQMYGKKYAFLYYYDRKVQVMISLEGEFAYKDEDVKSIISGISFY